MSLGHSPLDTGHSPLPGSGRLALLGVVFLGAALLCDAAWLTRSPGKQGGMAFGIQRFGLRADLSQAQFEALAIGMAVAGLASARPNAAVVFPLPSPV